MNKTAPKKLYSFTLKTGDIILKSKGVDALEALETLDPHKEGLFIFKARSVMTLVKGELKIVRPLTAFQARRVFNRRGFKTAKSIMADRLERQLEAMELENNQIRVAPTDGRQTTATADNL